MCINRRVGEDSFGREISRCVIGTGGESWCGCGALLSRVAEGFNASEFGADVVCVKSVCGVVGCGGGGYGVVFLVG